MISRKGMYFQGTLLFLSELTLDSGNREVSDQETGLQITLQSAKE